ncbi:MAG: SAM-dependent DNA methyltransferase, partial [Prevotellaceae bacterium]|nr:SAM-dependent DNA methyltransferase [Prevotellaceae bacterium]
MSEIKEKTLKLIDSLKATCQSYGMGNDGNEYKIITQVFLYKFLNDKFGYELKNAESKIAKKFTPDEKWETTYGNLSDDERKLILRVISPDVPILE